MSRDAGDTAGAAPRPSASTSARSLLLAPALAGAAPVSTGAVSASHAGRPVTARPTSEVLSPTVVDPLGSTDSSVGQIPPPVGRNVPAGTNSMQTLIAPTEIAGHSTPALMPGDVPPNVMGGATTESNQALPATNYEL